MRTSLIALASSFVLSMTSAFAADLPVTPPPPLAPAFTWTGFYLGGNIGGAWNSCGSVVPSYTGITPAVVAAFPGCGGNGGNARFIGGFQGGYNWQIGSLVLGLEGDFDFGSGHSNSQVVVVPAGGIGLLPAGTYARTGGITSSDFGTIRGRLGYAIDRVLLYVTGGAVFGSRSRAIGVSYTAPGAVAPTAVFGASSNGSGTGWTIGGGAEYAVTNNWTIKAEYLFAELGSASSTVSGAACVGASCAAFAAIPSLSFNGNHNRGENIARVGVNYKF